MELVLHSRQLLYLWRSSEGEGSSRPAPRRPCGSVMECMLCLWRSSQGEGGSPPAPRRPCGLKWSARCICGEAPKEKVAVDLHLVVLADWDGAHIAFVAKLRRRRWQSTCTSSSLRSGMERTLYLWRSSQGEGGSRPAPRRPCGLRCVSYLGEYWIAAKPASGRLAHHSVGFSNT